MAMNSLNFQETPLNFQKFKKSPKNRTNLKSFWAFLLSIFIYISVFYIFNLSPSTLLCTTKFWFFISNTLILIIVADFRSSSTREYNDFYEEYVKNDVRSLKTTIQIPSLDDIQPQHLKIVEKITTMNQDEKPSEKIINIVQPASVDDHEINHHQNDDEYKLDDPPDNPDEKVEKNEQEMVVFTHAGEGQRRRGGKKSRAAKCARSNSDRAIIVEAVEAEEAAAREEREEKFVLQRTMSERYDEEFDENEFAKMSNEELNKRVEEFIRRFNRQIRLQAISGNQEN